LRILGATRMRLQNLRVSTAAWLLPIAAYALAAGIFVADTLSDLEIAVPAFYTVVVLMSARFCKTRGIILVGVACVALTLLSDLLTAASGTSGIGFINTVISLLAIVTTTYLVIKIEAERTMAYEVRSQLVHVGRVTMLGELTASIAHEVNQPLAAVVINGNACLRWLAAQPPNLPEAKQAVGRLVNDANRASEIIAQVRALTKSSPLEKHWLDINKIILGTRMLIESEIQEHRVSFSTDLARDLPLVRGDRVQLQQVILNLILNAIEVMNSVPEGSRDLIISTARHDTYSVLVSVQDSGAGLAPENLSRLFNALYTTKPDGMGMGLAISRSIVEAHGGRIWATPNSPRGAVFQFTLPMDAEITS
jgi:signal transduction histidine kinase